MSPHDAALASALSDVVGAQVTNLRRLSAGASRETWSFDAGGRGLVLRRDPPGVPRPVEMAREAECLRAAAAAGVPVPALVAHGSEPVGTPFLVMERVDGETLPPRLLRDDRWAPVRGLLPRQFGRALARIHAVDPDAVPSCTRVEDRLAELRERHDAFGEPRPALELAFRWLDAHRPAAVAPTLVHGDFRNGNVIVDDDGLRAVLDWELVHVGDPREDLGWVCTRAWRFGSREPVGGFGGLDELLDGYAEVAGHRPDPADVRWWQVFGSVHWAVICRIQTERHLSGAERSLEMAVLGRRAVESEYDALLELGVVAPGPVALRETAVEDGPDRPTPDELLDAIAGFLTDELTTDDPRSRYLAKVARTGVGILRRERASGPRIREEHRARLAGIGCADDAALATGIRDGTLSTEDETVVDVVRRAVLDRLAVANPRYAEREQ
ncbi:phosphotransferase family protein [Pseudonocardia endophytica]|uniref:Aminoglycoside phosphotransferase (APT) family kinase protein n=1 Tax=Pseudonocardia endophytica TaxID=401976 RepID=A0A4R1HMG2_PSEEN|nr:phosphotransferase family protein [Pseudonocardia endophytica]TCK21745.1 aminoglycoside phosphotransferase (APT) family kinase protein [Pseudonocardia endophytica]